MNVLCGVLHTDKTKLKLDKEVVGGRYIMYFVFLNTYLHTLVLEPSILKSVSFAHDLTCSRVTSAHLP